LHSVDHQRGDLILRGQTSGGTAAKIGLNFVVPFVVSNLGFLAGTRTAQT
jgi:hypothetical protein